MIEKYIDKELRKWIAKYPDLGTLKEVREQVKPLLIKFVGQLLTVAQEKAEERYVENIKSKNGL